jgi:hypothetical protein
MFDGYDTTTKRTHPSAAENQSIRLVRLPVLPATIRQADSCGESPPVSVNHIPYRNYFLSRLPPFRTWFRW